MPRVPNFLKLLLESNSIPKPLYSFSGDTSPQTGKIFIKTKEEIAAIRSASKVARAILNDLKKLVCSAKEPFSASLIDSEMHKLCWKNRVYPSTLNYGGYPYSVCVSVNHEVCHGVPSKRKQLNLGDIVSIDLTVFNGCHGDVCGTFVVGGDKHATSDGRKLIEATERARDEAILLCRPGLRLRELGVCVDRVAKETGFRVIPNVCGHGVGIEFHEAPRIAFHSPDAATSSVETDADIALESGMVITIEPALTAGDGNVELNTYLHERDDWTIVTSDNSLCAQFEQTVLITDCSRGHEVLTA